MKKRYFIISAAFAILTGCSKEPQPASPVFKAVLESFVDEPSRQKTTIEKISGANYQVNWTADDRIGVNGKEYKVLSASGTTATFVNTGTESPTGSIFKACYPYSTSSYSAGVVSITIPDAQTEPATGLVTGFPMYAETTSNTFQFKNLCGLLCLNLKTVNGSAMVRSIKIESSNLGLSGDCSIEAESGAWKAVPKSKGTSITLSCAKVISSSSSAAFFLSVPAGDYSEFKLTFVTDCGTATRTSKNTISVLRSRITTISLTLDLDTERESVDLGLASGVKWSTKNVGAISVTDGGITNIEWQNASVSSFGGSWRLPTKDEFLELKSETYWTWTDGYKGTAQSGYIIYKAQAESDKGKVDHETITPYYKDDKDTHIFLPATIDGSQARYWSSSAYDADNAFAMCYTTGPIITPDKILDKTFYACVRPVL